MALLVIRRETGGFQHRAWSQILLPVTAQASGPLPRLPEPQFPHCLSGAGVVIPRLGMRIHHLNAPYLAHFVALVNTSACPAPYRL